MGKLTDLLQMFREDKNWNTPNRDGTHRFDEKIAWIKRMVNEYAESLNISTDECVEILERNRTYSWPNYYQKANFPGLDSREIYGVFETTEDFHKHSKTHWKGFRCPKCGDVSNHPQECTHRRKSDGKCDWCSYGLFRSEKGVVILQNGLNLIPIFEPIPKEGGGEDG